MFLSWLISQLRKHLGKMGMRLLGCVVLLAIPGVGWLFRFGPPPFVKTWVHVLRHLLDTANPDRFSVTIAQLDQDPDGQTQMKILDLLNDLEEFEGIQLIRLYRLITVEGFDWRKSVEAGHKKARAYLRRTHADVLIWGQAHDPAHSQAERGNSTVIHQTPPALRVDRLQETGRWNVLGRITDETMAVQRIKASLEAPVYHFFSNNCEQFARFVATGKRESRQLQAVGVVFGLLILGFVLSR